MNWGPFNSELGGKPIMDHIQNQVFPVLKEIQLLSLEIGDYKQGFFNSFFRGRLYDLQTKYQSVNKKFLQAYHIYQTPDELFKDVMLDQKRDKEKIAIMMMDYLKSKNLITPHFQEGFTLLEIMDRNTTRYSQSADQRVSTVLSILAITISVILAISNN